MRSIIQDNDVDFESDSQLPGGSTERFRTLLQTAISGINSIRHGRSTTRPARQRRGPAPVNVRVFVYLLPEGSPLPRFSVLDDPLKRAHFISGFGMLSSLFVLGLSYVPFYYLTHDRLIFYFVFSRERYIGVR